MSTCARSCTPVCPPPIWTCRTHPHSRATLWPALSNYHHFVFPMTNFNICFYSNCMYAKVLSFCICKKVAVFKYKILRLSHYVFTCSMILYIYQENISSFCLHCLLRVDCIFCVSTWQQNHVKDSWRKLFRHHNKDLLSWLLHHGRKIKENRHQRVRFGMCKYWTPNLASLKGIFLFLWKDGSW